MPDKASLQGSQGRSGSIRAVKLTPKLVKEITARVYALWLLDLGIEHERQRGQNDKKPSRL